MLMHVPKALQERILSRIMRDLEPAWGATFGKIAAASLMGGMTSLFICGQFGLGLSGFADAFNQSLHHHTGDIACALICGILFAALPMAMLRFVFCSPIQFKAIMNKRWQAFVILFAILGTVLAAIGTHNTGILAVLAWLAGALLAAKLLAQLLYATAPTWDLRTEADHGS